MKIQGAITNVKRPANGDNFGNVSIEQVLITVCHNPARSLQS
jgi:hypothetical protein